MMLTKRGKFAKLRGQEERKEGGQARPGPGSREAEKAGACHEPDARLHLNNNKQNKEGA